MIAHVIPAKRGTPHLAWFDYLVPPELEKSAAVGQLVRVPFRSGEMFGVIHSLAATPQLNIKLKVLKEIIRPEPFISPPQFAFLEEMAALYRASLGFLVKTNLPPLQKRKLRAWKMKKQKKRAAPDRRFAKPRVFIYADAAERKDISARIAADGQTLILVPEVGGIKSIFKNLTPTRQRQTIVITGEVSQKDLFNLWQQVWSGKKKIILGTRRALFLPFSNLAVIIIDDEGNENHKSFDLAPRFHARDAAIMLARHHGAAVHLAAFAPTVETYYFAKKKVYEAAPARLLPIIRKRYALVDIGNDRRGGIFSAVTLELAEHIRSAPQGTIFLFCHRRGTLRYVSCRDCKTAAACPVCHEPLAYHAVSKTLECHHCSHRELMMAICGRCQGANIAMFGPGTEQAANELKKILPNDPRPIIVVDSDTPPKLNDDSDHIFIGTQNAWSAVPWQKVSLMAFIDADTPLFIPEYKTGERLWQALMRSLFLLPETTPLFIQTAHQEHFIFQALAAPELFYERELAERRMFGYPPFRFILRLFTSGKNHALLKGETGAVEATLKRLTRNDSAVTITPAADMFPRFQRGAYWQAIVVKIGYAHYKKVIRQILAAVPETWKVDPNPNTLLSF